MKKKILFVINTLGHAGAEVAMLELLGNLDAKKYDISLYVLLGQGELITRIPNHVKLLNKKYDGASVLSKRGKRSLQKSVLHASVTKASLFKNLPYISRNLLVMQKNNKIWGEKLLWRVVSDGAQRFDMMYDLAVAYLEGGSAYYVADHVKAKKKAAFIHIDYTRAGYTRELDKECYLSFDRIFTVSDEVKQHFLKVYPECNKTTQVFHNMVNQQKIRELAKQKGGFSDSYEGIRLLTVGRLTYQKAYDIAIKAMRLLKEDGFLARWYVLGEGNLKKSLKKQIEEANLQEDFILLGANSNPYPFYAQTDIYVHATRFEGKSIAIQEAQTLGCPIIASDCSGNREQIENGVDGILCDLTPETLKESIEELIKNKQKREAFAKASVQKELIYKEDLEMLTDLIMK